MARPRCPICRREAERSASPAFPFCSERCRLIDLGRWLGEEYRVPVENVDADVDAGTDAGGSAGDAN